jgi:DNA-binding transcriptional MerR regulator
MHRAPAENIVKSQRPFPDKLFYKIGEVSRIAGVEPYVLRYWETEFSFLRPRKNKSGQRVYTRKDLDMVLQVKKMLYEDRYTIEGVRKKFGDPEPPRQIQIPALQPSPAKDVVEKVKTKLRQILSQLQ